MHICDDTIGGANRPLAQKKRKGNPQTNFQHTIDTHTLLEPRFRVKVNETGLGGKGGACFFETLSLNIHVFVIDFFAVHFKHGVRVGPWGGTTLVVVIRLSSVVQETPDEDAEA